MSEVGPLGGDEVTAAEPHEWDECPLSERDPRDPSPSATEDIGNRGQCMRRLAHQTPDLLRRTLDFPAYLELERNKCLLFVSQAVYGISQTAGNRCLNPWTHTRQCTHTKKENSFCVYQAS